MTKVYLATSGEYSDFVVRQVFAHEEDAQSYQLADNVLDFELQDGPVEVRLWHTLHWNPKEPDQTGDPDMLENPWSNARPQEFDDKADFVEHRWVDNARRGDLLIVTGWDRERLMKVYSEQRAKYLAQQSEPSEVSSDGG